MVQFLLLVWRNSNVVEDTTQTWWRFRSQWKWYYWKWYCKLAVLFHHWTVDIDGNVELTGTVNVTGIVTATSFVKSGGTSSQYLMNDGTVSTGGGTGPQGVQVLVPLDLKVLLVVLVVEVPLLLTRRWNNRTKSVNISSPLATSTIATSDSSDFTVVLTDK